MFHGTQFATQVIAGGLLGVLSLAGLGCQGSYAGEDEWVPVVAKLRRTVTELPANGAPVEKEVWEGVYLRDSRGSELRKLEQVSPRPDQPKLQGMFLDRSGSQWKTYWLGVPAESPLTQPAVERPDPAASREQLISAGRQEDEAHGIRCFVVPIESQAFTPVVISGGGCYSPEHDLHLYQELDRTVSESGLTIRTRTEFYEFQLGIAPAADQMCFPPGVLVQESVYPTCSEKPRTT